MNVLKSVNSSWFFIGQINFKLCGRYIHVLQGVIFNLLQNFDDNLKFHTEVAHAVKHCK